MAFLGFCRCEIQRKNSFFHSKDDSMSFFSAKLILITKDVGFLTLAHQPIPGSKKPVKLFFGGE